MSDRWAEFVRDGLRCARNDSKLLDGRDFDEAFWDGKDAALDALVAERDEAQRLLREVVKADRQDAQMGYPIPGDSCMGAFIGLVLMQYLDSLAKEEG